MLIVQRLITEWTKASRGGDGAHARNATPLACPIPPVSDPKTDYLLHYVRFCEEENFAPRSRLSEAEGNMYILAEPLFLYLTKDQVSTRFVWTWDHCGAPERDSHDLFRLSLGEWGRFTCNGRFGASTMSGREWGYHKTVFNVALVSQFDANLFLNSSPVADESQLAILR